MQSLGLASGQGGLRLAQWHAVPDVLGASKQGVAMFARRWNENVSPGQPVFARNPAGQRILDENRQKNPLGVTTLQRTVWQ